MLFIYLSMSNLNKQTLRQLKPRATVFESNRPQSLQLSQFRHATAET